MQLLFLHGAGGYADDRPLADGLAAELGIGATMPRLPDTDMSYRGWAEVIRAALTELESGEPVVAHSFGASVLLRVLAEQEWPLAGATLLGMPDWSSDGWDVADYAFTGSEPSVPLTLHHCRDDEVVPFEHVALHRRRLPSARIVEHPTGGHQFEGLAGVLAADLS